MSNFFSLENPVMSGLFKVMNCILLALLWLICCIPLITIGASTTALYAAVQKTIKHDRGYVTQEFFKSFTANFKQATIIWLGLAAVALIFAGDISILKAVEENGHMWANIYVLFQILLAVEFIYAIYVFSYIARFRDTVKGTLKNAALLMLKFPGSFLKVLLIVLFGFAVTYILPLLIFIMPVIVIWLGSMPLEKLYHRYMNDEDRETEAIKNNKYDQLK